jgi:hypothetical protein
MTQGKREILDFALYRKAKQTCIIIMNESWQPHDHETSVIYRGNRVHVYPKAEEQEIRGTQKRHMPTNLRKV